MTDRHEPLPDTTNAPADGQTNDAQDIPFAELVRAAREMTNRINNEDRQRLAADLSESGHNRAIQSSAPYLLQGFFTGKLDLDIELMRRYPAPPLLASMTFAPKPGQSRKHGFAQFASQDTASVMTIEAHSATGALDFTFLLYSMIGVHFTLGAIPEANRKHFLSLMERKEGVAFLWTRERWESDYVIFVVRDHFARVYAFGSSRVEAACRLPPEAVTQLRLWLTGFWNLNAEPPADSPFEF